MDLRHVNACVADLVLADVADTIAAGAFVEGPAIASFERMFADYCGVREAVAVASGLDALRLALIALGVGAGDEVIVPAETFIATFEAVSQAGATPVVVDVTDRDYTIDPDQVEARIGPAHAGGGARAHVRADGRHAADARGRGKPRPAPDRGRLPGSRRSSRRPPRRRRRRCRGIQLLPVQEPGSHGRRRSNDDRRQRGGGHRSLAALARAVDQGRVGVPGLHGPHGHPPGGGAGPQAAAARRLER